MMTGPISRVFGAAPHRRCAMATLAAATFALLCVARTGALADCRDEVAAAFERLKTSGRPYRMETASIISDQQTSHKTSEFVPPDRMRVVTSNGVPGYSPDETIRVGQRAWLNENGGWPWGWREWDPRPAEDFLARMEKIPADDVDARARIFREVRSLAISSPAFASSWVHVLALQNDYPIPADAVFECLGKVEFEGTVYLGYRRRFDTVIVSEVAPGVSGQTEQQQLTRKPQEWRTVLVDRDSMLPAFDLVSQAYQLNNARDKVEYTYPNSIKIEPPLWCRLGLCRSVSP